VTSALVACSGWCEAGDQAREARPSTALNSDSAALNLRGVVLHEGPQSPFFSHAYIVVINRFVAAWGDAAALAQGLPGWPSRWPLWIVLSQPHPLERLACRPFWAGQADLPGYLRPVWAAYFRVAPLALNADGLFSVSPEPLSERAGCGDRRQRESADLDDAWRPPAAPSAAFATGSRLGQLLAPLLVGSSFCCPHAPSPSTRSKRRMAIHRGAGDCGGHPQAGPGDSELAALALVLLHQAGLDYVAAYVFFRAEIQWDDGRLTVLALLSRPASSWSRASGFSGQVMEQRGPFCDEDVGLTVSHAHNFIVQIVGRLRLDQ